MAALIRTASSTIAGIAITGDGKPIGLHLGFEHICSEPIFLEFRPNVGTAVTNGWWRRRFHQPLSRFDILDGNRIGSGTIASAPGCSRGQRLPFVDLSGAQFTGKASEQPRRNIE
jgi:hypothetical protein